MKQRQSPFIMFHVWVFFTRKISNEAEIKEMSWAKELNDWLKNIPRRRNRARLAILGDIFVIWTNIVLPTQCFERCYFAHFKQWHIFYWCFFRYSKIDLENYIFHFVVQKCVAWSRRNAICNGFISYLPWTKKSIDLVVIDVFDHGIGTYSRKTAETTENGTPCIPIEPFNIVVNIGGCGSDLYSATELGVLERGEGMSAARNKCTNSLCSSSDKRGASSVNVALPSLCKMRLRACRDGLFKL